MICSFNKAAVARLQILVLAKELSAKVIASIFFLSIAFAPSINLSIFKCFGGSNSAIIVTCFFTLSTIVGLLFATRISSSSAGRGVIIFLFIGFRFLIPLFIARMCSGVVPQHPPINLTPSSTNNLALCSKYAEFFLKRYSFPCVV